MEMYADEDARGGVLEPEGIVNIKYRRDKQLDTMARLDPVYGELKRSLADKSLSSEQLSDVKVKMSERESLLLPVYSQISLQFADLHDRAGRMQAKGTIRMPLRWKESRRFFYWRLRRRLNEEMIVKKLASITASSSPLTASGRVSSDSASTTSTATSNGSSSTSAAAQSRARHLATLKAWSSVPQFDRDDRAAAMWYEENRKEVNSKVEALRQQGVAHEIASLLRGGNREAGLRGVRDVLGMMPVGEREAVLKMLGGQ